MAREPSPAFQFYPRDWLSDERVLVMDCAARGAYINLLAVCWLEDTLPGDDRALGRLAQAYPSEWKRLRDVVLACFVRQSDGRYRHRRLDLEREKQTAYREKQAAKGRAAAEQRLNRGSTVVQPKGVPEGSRRSTLLLQSSVRTHTQREGARADKATRPSKPLGYKPRIDVAWPGRPPVPGALHAEFRDKLGGDPNDADVRLRAWYPEAARPWEDKPIGDDDFRFWRARFREWVGGTDKPPRLALDPPVSTGPWCEHDPLCLNHWDHARRLEREADAVADAADES